MSTDRDRLAFQFRIVALLDRCIEGVHVDMDDLRCGAQSRRLCPTVFLYYAEGSIHNFTNDPKKRPFLRGEFSDPMRGFIAATYLL
jgi:hypothetical protein